MLQIGQRFSNGAKVCHGPSALYFEKLFFFFFRNIFKLLLALSLYASWCQGIIWVFEVFLIFLQYLNNLHVCLAYLAQEGKFMGHILHKNIKLPSFSPQGSLRPLLLNHSHLLALMLTLSLCLETNLLMLS